MGHQPGNSRLPRSLLLFAVAFTLITAEPRVVQVKDGNAEKLEITCIQDQKDFCRHKPVGFEFNDGCRECKCKSDDSYCKTEHCVVRVERGADPNKYCHDVMMRNEGKNHKTKEADDNHHGREDSNDQTKSVSVEVETNSHKQEGTQVDPKISKASLLNGAMPMNMLPDLNQGLSMALPMGPIGSDLHGDGPSQPDLLHNMPMASLNVPMNMPNLAGSPDAFGAPIGPAIPNGPGDFHDMPNGFHGDGNHGGQSGFGDFHGDKGNLGGFLGDKGGPGNFHGPRNDFHGDGNHGGKGGFGDFHGPDGGFHGDGILGGKGGPDDFHGPHGAFHNSRNHGDKGGHSGPTIGIEGVEPNKRFQHNPRFGPIHGSFDKGPMGIAQAKNTNTLPSGFMDMLNGGNGHNSNPGYVLPGKTGTKSSNSDSNSLYDALASLFDKQSTNKKDNKGVRSKNLDKLTDKGYSGGLNKDINQFSLDNFMGSPNMHQPNIGMPNMAPNTMPHFNPNNQPQHDTWSPDLMHGSPMRPMNFAGGMGNFEPRDGNFMQSHGDPFGNYGYQDGFHPGDIGNGWGHNDRAPQGPPMMFERHPSPWMQPQGGHDGPQMPGFGNNFGDMFGMEDHAGPNHPNEPMGMLMRAKLTTANSSANKTAVAANMVTGDAVKTNDSQIPTTTNDQKDAAERSTGKLAVSPTVNNVNADWNAFNSQGMPVHSQYAQMAPGPNFYQVQQMQYQIDHLRRRYKQCMSYRRRMRVALQSQLQTVAHSAASSVYALSSFGFLLLGNLLLQSVH